MINFKNVIFALIKNEIRTRTVTFVGKLEFLTQYISFTLPIFMIRMLLNPNNPLENMVVFILTGLFVILFFNKTLSYCGNIIKQRSGFLIYKQVTIFRLIVSRVIIELMIFFLSFGTAYLLYYFITNKLLIINNILQFIQDISYLAILGAVIGITMSVLSTSFRIVGVFIPYLTRIIYFTSGTFFFAHEIPYFLYSILTYNPIMHIVISIRNNFGLYTMYIKPDYSYAYVFLIISLFVCKIIHLRYYRNIFLKR